MTQAIFLASGNTIEEALSFAASLIGNILIGQKELPASDRVDVSVSYTHLTLPTIVSV